MKKRIISSILAVRMLVAVLSVCPIETVVSAAANSLKLANATINTDSD